MTILLNCLLIFAARVVDVSLGTVRTIMLVRGKRLVATVIGFFEVLIFITVLQKVLGSLDAWYGFVAYAGGFATGNYVGSMIEEKLAIGFLTVQVVSMNCPYAIVQKLRNMGFGVTVIQGQGREGDRLILQTYLRRKDLNKIISSIDELDPKAFITVMDAKSLKGGFGLLRKGK